MLHLNILAKSMEIFLKKNAFAMMNMPGCGVIYI